MAVVDESEATCAVRMGTRARAGYGYVRVVDVLTRSANAGTDAIRAMDIKRWRARGISNEGNNARWETREFVWCRDEKERRDGLIDFAFRSHRPRSHFDREITLFAFKICVKTPRLGFAKLVSRRTPAPRELTPATARRVLGGSRDASPTPSPRSLNPRPGAHIPRRTNPPRVTTHRRQ